MVQQNVLTFLVGIQRALVVVQRNSLAAKKTFIAALGQTGELIQMLLVRSAQALATFTSVHHPFVTPLSGEKF